MKFKIEFEILYKIKNLSCFALWGRAWNVLSHTGIISTYLFLLACIASALLTRNWLQDTVQGRDPGGWPLPEVPPAANARITDVPGPTSAFFYFIFFSHISSYDFLECGFHTFQYPLKQTKPLSSFEKNFLGVQTLVLFCQIQCPPFLRLMKDSLEFVGLV